MAQSVNVSESDYKRQFLQHVGIIYNAANLDGAVATHTFYTGPSNFVKPTLFQTTTPIQTRVAYLQSLNQDDLVDSTTLYEMDNVAPRMSTLITAYRKVANPQEPLVYEQQNPVTPLDADENVLAELQANSEFVLVGPSSAIVEVRIEHMDVQNVDPFLPQIQPVVRYFVKSFATNSWALCAASYTQEGEFHTLYYPTLDALLSLLAGTRISLNTNNVPLGQLPPGMTRGMEFFMFIQALGVPPELRQANDELFEENNSPSNESRFQ